MSAKNGRATLGSSYARLTLRAFYQSKMATEDCAAMIVEGSDMEPNNLSISEHNYSKNPEGLEVSDVVPASESVSAQQDVVTNLDDQVDNTDGLLLSLLRDLSEQMKRKQGEGQWSSPEESFEICHEALAALSEGQILSLMTSSSVNYDIVHQLMQMKRQSDLNQAGGKSDTPDSSPTSDSRPTNPLHQQQQQQQQQPQQQQPQQQQQQPMDTSDDSQPQSQGTPPPSLSTLTQTDLTALVSQFSTLDSQGKQYMVDYLVRTIVKSGLGAEGTKGVELNDVLKNTIVLLQQQVNSAKGVNVQQLQQQLAAKSLADHHKQNLLSQLTHPSSPIGNDSNTTPSPSDDVMDGDGMEAQTPDQQIPEPFQLPIPEPEPEPEPRCVNRDCPNLPVENEERGPLYCSNTCVVLHCRDIFTSWVREKKLRTK